MLPINTFTDSIATDENFCSEAVNQKKEALKSKPFKISSSTSTRLNFWDRLKILFGREITVKTTITVSDPVGIIDTDATVTIDHRIHLSMDFNDGNSYTVRSDGDV